jgi:hypothetical protein
MYNYSTYTDINDKHNRQLKLVGAIKQRL